MRLRQCSAKSRSVETGPSSRGSTQKVPRGPVQKRDCVDARSHKSIAPNVGWRRSSIDFTIELLSLYLSLSPAHRWWHSGPRREVVSIDTVAWKSAALRSMVALAEVSAAEYERAILPAYWGRHLPVGRRGSLGLAQREGIDVSRHRYTSDAYKGCVRSHGVAAPTITHIG